MIDVLESLVEQLRTINEFDGRIYRRWPKKNVTLPSCIISRISGYTKLSDDQGEEIVAELVYSVDINAKTADEVDMLADSVANVLARYNFHRTGDTDLYDDNAKASRRVLTFMGTVDKRGNTFTN